MLKFLLSGIAIFICSAAYAGSCTDCLKTFKKHVKECGSEKICAERAQERYNACLIGCTK